MFAILVVEKYHISHKKIQTHQQVFFSLSYVNKNFTKMIQINYYERQSRFIQFIAIIMKR
jgi:hypothetical protein